MGVEYIHFVAPNKVTVYPEYVNADLPRVAEGPLRTLLSAVRLDPEADSLDFIVNPLPYYDAQKPSYELYLKTDTHWSFFGCFSAYQLLCNRLGVPARRDLVSRPFSSALTMMDLGARLDPPLREEVRFYQVLRDSRRVFRNQLVKIKEERGLENAAGLHVGSQVIFENVAPVDERRVVLFGDSFSEYRTHLLTGLLAETFQELHFVWSSDIDFSYIERHRPHIVVCQMVERFMTRMPTDDFDLESFCASRIASL